MQNIRKFGLVSLLATSVALGGCDDDTDDSSSSAATMTMTATVTDTDGSDTDESSTGDGIDCSAAPSHEADIQPIWDANCVEGCHEPGGGWPSTDLSPGMAYDALVDADGIQTMALTEVSLVIPEDVDNSYLLNKLNGTQEAVAGAAAGGRMPTSTDPEVEAEPLSDADIELVELWIACGAEE